MITSALGLDAGDQILQETAKRIQQCIRQLDTAARFAGNDFALILPQLTKSETAAYVAQRLLDAIAKPFIIQDKEIFVAANIGISIYPNDGDDIKVLMKNAETALHQAIVHGHHMYQFFRDDMQLTSKREFILNTSLQNPSVHEDFLIYYQPIVDIEKHKISAMQAKIYWKHADCGLLELKDFIKLAEGNGSIVRIGEWLIRHACQQFQEWQSEGYDVETIAIGISPRQLENPHFVYKVTQIFKEYHIEPERVLFEVSESSLMSRMGMTEKTLLMLKELGVRLGICEFGTGNMVMWRLQGFQVDSLKIAESIIKNITVSQETMAIVKMIIAIANTLNLEVMAEGVATLKQVQALKELHCKVMQGDVFSKPLLPTEFTPLVQKTILDSMN